LPKAPWRHNLDSFGRQRTKRNRPE
jgi:hypothetical protein